GYSGAAGGLGDTENARLDNSARYINQIGMFRVGAQFQSGAGTADQGNATELDLGGDFLPGFSLDAAYGIKKGALLLGALSAAQVAALPNSIAPDNAVAATVSDHWCWQLGWRYVYKAA